MIKSLVAFLSSRFRQLNLVETMNFYAVAKGRQTGIFSTWFVLVLKKYLYQIIKIILFVI